MNVNIKVSFQSVHNFFKLLSHQMRHVHEARGDSDERKKSIVIYVATAVHAVSSRVTTLSYGMLTTLSYGMHT